MVSLEMHFDAAHRLFPYRGLCANLHGHRWKVIAYAERVDNQALEDDMVVDFKVLRLLMRTVIDRLDHNILLSCSDPLLQVIRDQPTLVGQDPVVLPSRPTAERIAEYIYHAINQQITSQAVAITSVDVFETPEACATYPH